MRYHYAILFLFIFNGVVPLVGAWGIFGASQPNSNYAGWTIATIAAPYGCNANVSSTGKAGSCTSPTPNGNWFANIFTGFGDWLDATIGYITAFAVGVFLPQWYMVNLFHIPLAWAVVISGPMYILYAAFFSFFFGFRSPEAGT